MENNDPDRWWKNGIIYHIYPQSFCDSNADGIGDLRGIISKLDYLVQLGVDAIWLSPVYPSPLIDAGYDISDYYDIHPQYGTMDDFRELLDAAHARHIRVIMDMVLNHTSYLHPWFSESASSRNNPKRDWYIWKPSRNGKQPNNWRTNYGKKAWQYHAGTGEYYYHSFFREQPDLNWRNPEVRAAMFQVIKHWLALGVDGFRLDVINLLFKDEKGRDNPIFSLFTGGKVFNYNQPEVYDVLREFRCLLNQYPGCTSVGEVFTPPPGNSRQAAAFLGNGTDMLHMAFDFSLIFTRWRASSYYKAIRNSYRQIPPGGWPCFFFSNHDIGRYVARSRFTATHKYDKARLHALLLLTLRGTPFIYYGDEIGMENAEIPREKIHDLYGRLFYPLYKGRDGARTPMQWSDAPHAGFSTVEPFLPVHVNHKQLNVEAQQQSAHSILATFQTLIEIRRQYVALQEGEIEFLNEGNRNVLAYTRTTAAEQVVVLVNFGSSFKKVSLREGGRYTVLYSTCPEREVQIPDKIRLQPYEGILLTVTPL